MTPSDHLRMWALSLRAILEAEHTVTSVALALENGSNVSYERNVGLTYETPEGTCLHVPEDALDTERWEAVS